jgi:hypothetical protein
MEDTPNIKSASIAQRLAHALETCRPEEWTLNDPSDKNVVFFFHQDDIERQIQTNNSRRGFCLVCVKAEVLHGGPTEMHPVSLDTHLSEERPERGVSSTQKIDHPSSVDGPVGSEGGRSLCTRSTGQAPPALTATPAAAPPPRLGPLAPGQR